jgi:hypothetical protein
MASKKIKDLCVATSKYTNRNGEEKSNWLNIGAIFEKDDGGKYMMLKRTFNPAGMPNPDNRDTIIVSMFDVKPKNEDNAQGSVDTAGKGDNPFSDDNIPF